jgi:hypothetical protein
MQLKESKTITLHDQTINHIRRQIARRSETGGGLTDMVLAEKARVILGCFPQLPCATKTRTWTVENQRTPDSVQS